MTAYGVTVNYAVYTNGRTVNMVEGDTLKFTATAGTASGISNAAIGIYGTTNTTSYPYGSSSSYPNAFKSSTYWTCTYHTSAGCIFGNRSSMALPAGRHYFTSAVMNLSNGAVVQGHKIIVNVASSSNIHAKVNGTWVDGKVYVNVNGTWKEGKPYVNVNGTWKAGK